MKILITGAGGMIGTHLTNRLIEQGHEVVGVDIKKNEFIESKATKFQWLDCTDQQDVRELMETEHFDEVYNLAAVMGGMELLSDGKYDYQVLNESSLINWNVLGHSIITGVKKIFFSSSACVYNMTKQETSYIPALKEEDSYPALPDLEYGYQKLITERLYMSADRCTGIECRIGRFHNIYGRYGEWEGIKAKAPSALCRKVAMAKDGDSIEVFGDGLQTRSFTAVEDCLDGIQKLMGSNYNQPINIGSDEMVTINQLAQYIIDISGKTLTIKNIDGPQGVRGRNSDNTLVMSQLNWKPTIKLREGLKDLYKWIEEQVNG